MRSCPRPRKNAVVARAGAVPCPLSASVSRVRASCTSATHSPQSVYDAVGSITAAANPAAATASNALPPERSMRMPAIDTSGCPPETTPCMPDTTGRVVVQSAAWCSISWIRPVGRLIGVTSIYTRASADGAPAPRQPAARTSGSYGRFYGRSPPNDHRRGTGRTAASGRAIDRPARDDTPEIGQLHRLDPMTARLYRAGLEPKSREHRGVAVVAVVGVPDECVQDRGIRLLDARQRALAIVRAEPR